MLRTCVTTSTAAVAASLRRRRISQRSGREVVRHHQHHHHCRRSIVMSGTATSGEKVYPEEQKVEVGGKLYRRCASALVFNLKGEVLVGERTDRPGSWNMPQGGVEVCACVSTFLRESCPPPCLTKKKKKNFFIIHPTLGTPLLPQPSPPVEPLPDIDGTRKLPTSRPSDLLFPFSPSPFIGISSR